MAEPMFFVDAATSPAAADEALRAADQAELLRLPLVWSPAGEGPTGKPGMLGAWMQLSGDSGSVGHYAPGTQNWRPFDDSASVWFGAELARPVRPCDLACNLQHDGEELILADGQRWLIPIARGLPHIWTPGGRVPKAPYAQFCGRVDRMYQMAVGSSQEQSNFLVEWDFICQTLALNYRISPALIGMLELVDDRCAVEIIETTIELRFIRQVMAEKKKG